MDLSTEFLNAFDRSDGRWAAGDLLCENGGIKSYEQIWGHLNATVVDTNGEDAYNMNHVHIVKLEFPGLTTSQHQTYSELQEMSRIDATDNQQGYSSLRAQGVDILCSTSIAWQAMERKQCSCNDFNGISCPGVPARPDGVPCAHIAAVLYRLAASISADARNAFLLRRIDPSWEDRYQDGLLYESTPPAKKQRRAETSNGVKIEKNAGDSESQAIECVSSCPSSPNSVPAAFEDSQRSPQLYNSESQPVDLDY